MKLPTHGALLSKLVEAAAPGQTVSAKVKTSVKVKKSRIKSSVGGARRGY